jgi:Na+-translocating ferredoxin:NAD+ oxidoreductase subunit B
VPNAADTPATASELELASRLDAALPQTQCTRCGYPSCRDYAMAIAVEGVAINRCPPGGAQGVQRLAAIAGQPVVELDASCGVEGPRGVVHVIEANCIGCTLCISACPVDCIVGAPKRMHVVIESQCTGCELCLPACPVDCIAVETATPGRGGWDAWSPGDAARAKASFEARTPRIERLIEEQRRRKSLETDTTDHDDASRRKRELVQAALERARVRLKDTRPDPTP